MRYEDYVLLAENGSKKVGESISGMWKNFKQSFDENWNGMNLKEKLNFVKDKFNEAMGHIQGIFNDIAGVVTGFMQNELDQMVAKNKRKWKN